MQEPSIRTLDRRFGVFVSSTLAELAEERGAVHDAIEGLRPGMFELGEGPHSPETSTAAYPSRTTFSSGSTGNATVWIAPGETISGLEDEYFFSIGMPRAVIGESAG
jgi:hypothetical protein